MIPQSILPIALLAMSNIFMTFAWYGHLKFTDKPLWLVITGKLENCASSNIVFAVPANRFGHAVYSAAQLKTMQEVITLIVFAIILDRVPERADHHQSWRRICADRARRLFRL